jgi:hypothetical protein
MLGGQFAAMQGDSSRRIPLDAAALDAFVDAFARMVTP